MPVGPNGTTIVPRVGLLITESVRLTPGRYLVASPPADPDAAAITIRGDDLTVDFGEAELLGTPRDTLPDQRTGTAIRVEGHNVTIRNARVRGYKVGLFGDGAPGLRVISSDFSYNWKQRLGSTQEREDLADWLSFHHNEQAEWLGHGAAVYLRGCDRFEIRGVRVTGGQCGLMLSECNGGLVWNSDCTFLSGIGLGMYRSSDNRVMHNRFDWCVRGYSHGVYNRGQDSAAILVFEQSCRNTIAYNSATHGGDGLFLWAGQSTMDTGRGGCNDNLVYGNDFSHAPTNGIEATFSRNAYVNNLIRECWHGFWGGYSFDSLLLDNIFADNEVGIAIEHGQANTIRGNRFSGDRTAIELWQRPDQDPNWGYPRYRDTRSRDSVILDNVVERGEVGVELRDTTGVSVAGNRFELVERALSLQGDTSGLRLEHNTHSTASPAAAAGPAHLSDGDLGRGAGRPESAWRPFEATRAPAGEQVVLRPEPLAGGLDPFAQADQPRGRETIIVDQWGPYDYRSPRIWPERVEPANEQGRTRRFRLLGPAGSWRLISASGVQGVEPRSGRLPGSLTIVLAADLASEPRLELEYLGAETVDFLGNYTAANQPVRFDYGADRAAIGPEPPP